jgi:hypothetical protein
MLTWQHFHFRHARTVFGFIANLIECCIADVMCEIIEDYFCNVEQLVFMSAILVPLQASQIQLIRGYVTGSIGSTL